MGHNNTTLKEIAALANVHISTVSKALSGSPLVKPDTAERVREVAKRLEYRREMLLKGVVSGKTFTVGVLIPDMSNSFYAEICGGVMEYLQRNGYSVLLGCTNFSANEEREFVDLFIAKKVEGIVSVSARYSDIPHIMPAVFIEAVPECKEITVVSIDNFGAAARMAEHLAEMGHRRIGFIGDTKTTIQRFRGFSAGLERFGLILDPKLTVIDEERMEKGGYNKMMQLLQRPVRPTAVFCVNDYLAIGALQAISEAGLRVPEDISVVGFDGIQSSAYVQPPLTTIVQPKEKMGQMGAELLLKEICGERAPGGRVVLPFSLAERKSAAPPRSE